MNGAAKSAEPKPTRDKQNVITYPPPLDMIQVLAFEIPGRAATQGSHSVSRAGRVFESSKNHGRWRKIVTAFARSAWRGREPLAGPLGLSVVFWLDRPESHYGTGRNSDRVKKSSPEHPTGKGTGDLDKLIRAIGDSLTDAGVIGDDSQIVQFVNPTGKSYVPARDKAPHAAVTVYQAPPSRADQTGAARHTDTKE